MAAMTSRAALALKPPAGGRGAGVQVGDDLLDDRVAAVLLLGVRDPAAQLVVPDGLRVSDRGAGVLADGGDGGADAGTDRDDDGETENSGSRPRGSRR